MIVVRTVMTVANNTEHYKSETNIDHNMWTKS